MYKINWTPALGDLRNLDNEIARRVVKKVGLIVGTPFRFVEHLEGVPLYKLRVGDYRVILDIKPHDGSIVVVLVDHRSRIYKRVART